jgi:outer membrane scaffolding protein for murein synthesis (MipA/OmpV family)
LSHSPRLALAVLPLLAAGTPALAQQSAAAEDQRNSITVGIGAIYGPDYEGSDDNRIAGGPAAVGSLGGHSFTILGTRASVDLIADSGGPGWDIEAGPIAVVNFDRTSIKSIDDPRVKALGEVDTAIELGGYAGIGKTGVITSPYDKLSVSLSWRHDVSGDHDSAIWQPSINYFTPLSSKAAVGLFASAEHVGDGYARTYFSVTPGQATASGLPAYDADGGWKNYTIGALGTYALTGDLLHGLKLVAGGTYKRLLGDFAESPVVSVAGDRDQWMGVVGIAYTF